MPTVHACTSGWPTLSLAGDELYFLQNESEKKTDVVSGRSLFHEKMTLCSWGAWRNDNSSGGKLAYFRVRTSCFYDMKVFKSNIHG